MRARAAAAALTAVVACAVPAQDGDRPGVRRTPATPATSAASTTPRTSSASTARRSCSSGNMGNTESEGGGFHAVDVAHPCGAGRPRPTSPGARSGAYRGCPGPPDPARFSVHGLDLTGPHRLRGQPRWARVDRGLPAGGRDTGLALTWIGLRADARGARRELGRRAAGRRVRGDRAAALRAGAAQRRAEAADRWRVPLVARRRAGASCPTSSSRSPTASSSRPTARRCTSPGYTEQAVARISLATGATTAKVAVPFNPDNLRWSPGGDILAAGQKAEPAVVQVTCVSAPVETCQVPTGVSRIDAGDDDRDDLLERAGDERFGAGTSAIVVGDELWIGSFRAQRLLRVPRRALAAPVGPGRRDAERPAGAAPRPPVRARSAAGRAARRRRPRPRRELQVRPAADRPRHRGAVPPRAPAPGAAHDEGEPAARRRLPARRPAGPGDPRPQPAALPARDRVHRRAAHAACERRWPRTSAASTRSTAGATRRWPSSSSTATPSAHDGDPLAGADIDMSVVPGRSRRRGAPPARRPDGRRRRRRRVPALPPRVADAPARRPVGAARRADRRRARRRSTPRCASSTRSSGCGSVPTASSAGSTTTRRARATSSRRSSCGAAPTRSSRRRPTRCSRSTGSACTRSRDSEPRFISIPESDRPVLQLPLGNDLIHAPTAAMLFQLRQVGLLGRPASASTTSSSRSSPGADARSSACPRATAPAAPRPGRRP